MLLSIGISLSDRYPCTHTPLNAALTHPLSISFDLSNQLDEDFDRFIVYIVRKTLFN
jgi:hypothetical protein